MIYKKADKKRMRHKTHREYTQIIKDILETIKKNKRGIVKYKLMQTSNLDFGSMEFYFNLFLRSNIIELRKMKLVNKWNSKTVNRIFLTKKGNEFLVRLKDLNSKLIKLEKEFLNES